MRLSDLQTGQTATIVKVLGHGAFRKRIMEMGFIRGKNVTVILNAPLKDPIIYKVMDYEVSLRRSEASLVEVITEQEAATEVEIHTPFECTVDDKAIANIIDTSKRKINIALVGNPNSGKTSLFNYASGSHEHVGNYSGVTVDAKRGRFKYGDYTFVIYDLPGTYALSAYTPEEVYVRKHLYEHTPDVVVNVVASSNLERNLYLSTELIDMDCSMVIALNMYDELTSGGGHLDYDGLGKMLGIPMIPTNSRNGDGFNKLFDTIIDVYENRNKCVRHIHINHGATIEAGIETLKKEFKVDRSVLKQFSPRYLAIKMLEKDKEIETLLSEHKHYPEWVKLRDQQASYIQSTLKEDIETSIANYKYGFISGALKEMYTPGEGEEVQTSRIIDSFVTHKLFGFPIFLFLMWVMFETTFKIGAYPMEWIESGVTWLSNMVQSYMSDGMLKDLIADGVIGGVGGVIVFLPNILILYLFISFMEDSGYMARAAFIMDKLMHRIGLHGKSFIPLIMGFGCNVPAIMSARTIESHSSKIITILINPFVSCSARLPVYILLVGAFFPNYSGLVLFGIYLLGILIAILTAKLMRKFLFKDDETPFVMELPPYRIPTTRSTIHHMWEKSWQYLRKMGGIILIASIAIWFLSYFPHNDQPHATQQKESYLGMVGQAFTPVMEPLDFDWRINVALISGTAAKEVIVSTLGVLYTENSNESTTTLSKKLQETNPETGSTFITPLTALTFMVFVLLYFPCIASLAAIKHETGSWKWSAVSVVYSTLMAWIVAFLVKTIGQLFI